MPQRLAVRPIPRRCLFSRPLALDFTGASAPWPDPESAKQLHMTDDRRVDPDVEVEQLDQLLEVLDIVNHLKVRVDRLADPQKAESDIALDEAKLGGIFLSKITALLLVSSTEQLDLVKTSLATRHIFSFAFYSLVRVSLELSATVVWLLAPDVQPIRVERRLRLELAYIRSYRQAAKGEVDSPAKDRRLQRAESSLTNIYALAVTNGLTKIALDKVPADSTFVIGYASAELTKSLPFVDQTRPGYYTELWRVASAFAHGRDWAHRTHGMVVETSDAPPDRTVQTPTVSMGSLPAAIDAAISMLMYAFDMYEKRAFS